MTEYLNENGTMERLWDRRTHFSRRLSSISLSIDGTTRSCGEIVTMMQTTNPWYRQNPAVCFSPIHCLTTGRRSL